MRRWRIAALCLVAMLPALAGAQPADTVRTPSAAAGVRLLQVSDPSGPWVVHIVEWDAALAPELRLLPSKAAQSDGERLAARETVESMAARSGNATTTVVAAINGDFFSPDGTPQHGMQTRGQWVQLPSPSYRQAALSVAADGRLWAGRVGVKGTACIRSNAVCLPLRINRAPADYEHGLLNGWFSDTLSLQGPGVFHVAPLGFDDDGAGSWRGTLSQYRKNSPAAFLRRDELVFVWAPALSWLPKEGDTLTVTVEMDGPPFASYALLGGGPVLLMGGNTVVDESAENEGIGAAFVNARHPRSAIGWNADQSKVWLVVVDGRQQHSVGMSLHELAAFLKRLGATEALNLDGGGSTTLIMDGVTRNNPSDATGPRPVGNALLLVK